MYHLSDPPPATIPTRVLQTPDGHPGLAVQYFDGVDFDKPAGKTIDEKLEHNWPGPPLADPPPGLNGFENFSARWAGSVTAPEDGQYEFGVEYDDGARLYLDGKLLIEDWSYGAKRYRGTKINLTKGQQVAIKAEFHQGGQERYFRLGWRTPSDLRVLASAKKELDNTMSTYLPAGAEWYDYWTNERVAGGRAVTKSCPLVEFPLYVRAGSIVPMGPVMQYATEKPDSPYEIRIYSGANAMFTMYEDDNETYAYERGERTTYSLDWNDAAKTLRLGARQGAFPGMVASRELKIVLITPGHIEPVRTIRYSGDPLEISLAQ